MWSYQRVSEARIFQNFLFDFFVMSEKVGPKYEEVLLEMLDSKEVHEMLDFCFLFPTLDQHFSVQAGRLTSLGSVLHEDGPLG